VVLICVDEKDLEDALRRQMAEKFIPVVEAELTEPELVIRDKVRRATAVRKDTRVAFPFLSL
jgi:hypothetical protein